MAIKWMHIMAAKSSGVARTNDRQQPESENNFGNGRNIIGIGIFCK